MVTAIPSTRRAPTLLVLVLVTAVAALAGVAQAGAPGTTPQDDESVFVASIARERSAHGLAGYAVAEDLVAVARGQAADMARQDRLYHNPDLTREVRRWQSVGENVGVGMTVGAIHDELMASSTHRREILSTRFTEVGVGVAHGSDGTIWVSQVFRLPLQEGQAAPAQRSPRRASRSDSRPASDPAAGPDPPRPATGGTEAAPLAPSIPVGDDTEAGEIATEPRPPLAPLAGVPRRAFDGPAGPEVTGPVQAAASLLVTVVAAQAAIARRLRLFS